MLSSVLPCLPRRQKTRQRKYLKFLQSNHIFADCKDFHLLKSQLDLTEYKYETDLDFRLKILFVRAPNVQISQVDLHHTWDCYSTDGILNSWKSSGLLFLFITYLYNLMALDLKYLQL